MQNRKRDADVQNRLLDSVGECEGGMFRENSRTTSILSRVNRSPAQVGCMRQVLRGGALGRPRGMGWGGRREGVSGRGTHVNPWLIHVNVWQKPLQYCKVISLQRIKINEKQYTLITCYFYNIVSLWNDEFILFLWQIMEVTNKVGNCTDSLPSHCVFWVVGVQFITKY